MRWSGDSLWCHAGTHDDFTYRHCWRRTSCRNWLAPINVALLTYTSPAHINVKNHSASLWCNIITEMLGYGRHRQGITVLLVTYLPIYPWMEWTFAFPAKADPHLLTSEMEDWVGLGITKVSKQSAQVSYAAQTITRYWTSECTQLTHSCYQNCSGHESNHNSIRPTESCDQC